MCELQCIFHEKINNFWFWCHPQVLMCADDLYRTFPNLYAIRGAPTRDVLTWVKSLDKMRALRPKYLVPSHTQPVEGKEYIEEVRGGGLLSQWTQNICITFVQCWANVEDVGPPLYKCYTNVLCLLGYVSKCEIKKLLQYLNRRYVYYGAFVIFVICHSLFKYMAIFKHWFFYTA